MTNLSGNQNVLFVLIFFDKPSMGSLKIILNLNFQFIIISSQNGAWSWTWPQEEKEYSAKAGTVLHK